MLQLKQNGALVDNLFPASAATDIEFYEFTSGALPIMLAVCKCQHLHNFGLGEFDQILLPVEGLRSFQLLYLERALGERGC